MCCLRRLCFIVPFVFLFGMLSPKKVNWVKINMQSNSPKCLIPRMLSILMRSVLLKQLVLYWNLCVVGGVANHSLFKFGDVWTPPKMLVDKQLKDIWCWFRNLLRGAYRRQQASRKSFTENNSAFTGLPAYHLLFRSIAEFSASSFLLRSLWISNQVINFSLLF